ncbi:ankyrin repeat domain-containing protein [Endozoicomonas euniceicola]|uniref:Ankyrin repeat domain-containing protein n=1 Tax=Endozoicomonas euniceicola TaxID=1234143 RepID=A0ABY6GYE1_9GAMM|nr:ankyrin repeat domain-containing protein [Endozoicomonas euniceicola]UYM17800.1 ankyrin repeat domain-containing protein [Endozoicomonas euniceicola]
MTASGLPPGKEELNKLIQLENQDETERRLNELLDYQSYKEMVNLICWFTTPMDENQLSFPSFLSLASGNQWLTFLLIIRMAGIINQPVWFPFYGDLLHTLINTDLFYSVTIGHLDRVVSLLNQHPNYIQTRDHNAHSLLSYAVRYGHNDIIRALMQRRAPGHPDRNGNDLMHLAVHYNQTSTIRLLLSLDYPVNRRNLRGETPLFLSILEGREFATRQLLAHGANADIADNQGRQPLQFTARNGLTNQVSLLIEQQLSPIEHVLERYGEVQTAESIAVSSLINDNAATPTFSSNIYNPPVIGNPHHQNLQRLCQNLRRFTGFFTRLLHLNQTLQLSLSHNLQLLSPEHQHRLREQHQQAQTLGIRLQQSLQHLENNLLQIRQDVSQSQQY